MPPAGMSIIAIPPRTPDGVVPGSTFTCVFTFSDANSWNLILDARQLEGLGTRPDGVTCAPPLASHCMRS